MWRALRAHRLNRASFRRQAPIGPYVVDFLCHTAGLVIEIDGGQHFVAEGMKRDARRDAFLASRGYRVMRFNNNEVLRETEGVLNTIAGAIAATPLPDPPPQGGRELHRMRGGTL
jgi:very-short-patch-repair endonuclease